MWKNTVNILLQLMLILLLSACATSYKSLKQAKQDANSRELSKGFGKLKKIAYYGNGYLKKEKAQIYALYRSAEYAKLENKQYFVLYPTLYAAAKGNYSHMPVVGMHGHHQHAFSFVYLSDKYIPGAHNVSDVLQQYKSQINKPGFRSRK